MDCPTQTRYKRAPTTCTAAAPALRTGEAILTSSGRGADGMGFMGVPTKGSGELAPLRCGPSASAALLGTRFCQGNQGRRARGGIQREGSHGWGPLRTSIAAFPNVGDVVVSA